MKVVYINRKVISVSKSIELYFRQVTQHLPDEIKYENFYAKFNNQGIIKRLLNVLCVLWCPKGDIYHVTGDANYLAILLPKKKTVLTVHDIYYVYYAQMTRNPVVRFIKYHFNKWFFYKLPVWRSAVVAVNSEFTKQELIRITDCKASKVIVAYCPIAPIFQPYPKEFNSEKPTLLQIGVMPNKNLLRLAEALKEIPCKLKIIGSPDAETRQQLTGYEIDFDHEADLSDEELLQKYIDCDMLTFVSTFEGFGMPIIEAQWIERPVITGNISAMPEVAGEGAYFVDPYDVSSIKNGIQTIISTMDIREKLIEKGRKNRVNFTSDKVANTYKAIYSKIIKAD